ncbi:hypothetical protein ACLMJK_002713 [Lecanora helva]
MALSIDGSQAAVEPFHPPRLTAPKRITTATQRLSILPREIVHQILDYLPLISVLQSASCQEASSYFDLCLIGHPQYKHIFPDHHRLTEIRDLFIIFYILLTSLDMTIPLEGVLSASGPDFRDNPIMERRVEHFLGAPVFRTLNSLPHIRRLSLNTVASKFKNAHLRSFGPQDFRLLHDNEFENFALNPTARKFKKARLRSFVPMNLRLLCDQWHSLKVLESTINEMWASEIDKMASIYEAFPKLLKLSSNPSQDARSNAEHVHKGLRATARSVRFNDWSTQRLRGRQYFKYHLMPLVPFDWCLRLFVRKLHEDPKAVGLNGSMIQAANSKNTKKPASFEYPLTVIEDIKTVLAGIGYVYTTAEPGTTDAPPKVLRTKFTPHFTPFQRPYTVDGTVNEQQNRQVCPLHWRPENLCQPVLSNRRAASADNCWNPSHEHPIFTSPPCRSLQKKIGDEIAATKIVANAEPTWERLMPYDEREFEWLEAFLRVVTFLKEMEEKENCGLEDSFQHGCGKN